MWGTSELWLRQSDMSRARRTPLCRHSTSASAAKCAARPSSALGLLPEHQDVIIIRGRRVLFAPFVSAFHLHLHTSRCWCKSRISPRQSLFIHKFVSSFFFFKLVLAAPSDAQSERCGFPAFFFLCVVGRAREYFLYCSLGFFFARARGHQQRLCLSAMP